MKTRGSRQHTCGNTSSPSAPLISAVLPCHNEAAALRRLLPGALSYIDELIVVDNGSTDDTAAIAAAFGAKVITEPRRGMGYAHRRGLAEASGDFIVGLDGDATYPIELVPTLIQFAQQHQLDFLACCRFPLTDPRAMSLRNQLGDRVLTWIANRRFGLQLRDALSGMWVIRRAILPELVLKEGGVPLCIEIKLQAFSQPRLRVTEVHIPYHRRVVGQSKLAPWRDGWRCLRLLWRWRASCGREQIRFRGNELPVES